MAQEKEGASKSEAPVVSTGKPQANQPLKEGKKNKKKDWKKTELPSYRLPRIQKYYIENLFNMARTLMELKDKEEQSMRQSSFPKKSLCLLRK
ncbi:hypothetical protein O181_041970 [Austropuccinia psidii MF-1]|uniref:Uncharacterized protein n=1 Tax=Austropuccinia psidii MF-1 TaxID=1389203 RepID=A0A9Q3HHN9_9BASI|nr:hypothetical protein [Austropuccinia psidii MF-1]